MQAIAIFLIQSKFRFSRDLSNQVKKPIKMIAQTKFHLTAQTE